MPLDKEQLEQLLTTRILGRAAGWENEVWDSIESTNKRGLELLATQAPEGIIVASRQQTAGRGRLGRTWVSPPDSGLYISFLLRPKLTMSHLPLLSLAAGAAAAKAIEETAGVRVGLKWVNDLIYDGRKVGGILAESVSAQANNLPPPVVLGIGINLRMQLDDVNDELAQKVRSLEDISGQHIDENVLAAKLTGRLEELYDTLIMGGAEAIVRTWKQHSVTIGRTIQATCGTSTYKGRAVDIDSDGALLLENEQGQLIKLIAGEVTIRAEDGSYV